MNNVRKTLLSGIMAKNLRKPSGGLIGKAIKQYLKKRNTFLAEKAVSLCEIQPNFHVLEIGFGSGMGLKKAAEFVKAGSGKVHGLDYSPAVIIDAIKSFPQEIEEGKLELTLGNVAILPYRDASMDRIFHMNCYYFWSDLEAVSHELLRVLKPSGLMVTLLSTDRMKLNEVRGFLEPGQTDPGPYMAALEKVGFVNTHMTTSYENNLKYESIFAFKR